MCYHYTIGYFPGFLKRRGLLATRTETRLSSAIERRAALAAALSHASSTSVDGAMANLTEGKRKSKTERARAGSPRVWLPTIGPDPPRRTTPLRSTRTALAAYKQTNSRSKSTFLRAG